MRLVVAMLATATACAEDRARPDSSPATGNVHPLGIDDKDSENFHGKELARRGYDFALCASCHGEDFAGGKAGVSCMTCHDDGPTACSTCHGDDGPSSGNHAVHRVDAMLACNECHRVPDRWDAPGHLGSVDVTFGPLASTGRPATFTAGACGVYCHGDARPRWDAAPVKSCDRCHGAPPPSHAQSDCATCHPPSAPHVDGTLQVGRTAGCDGCHGAGGDAAPPADLAGNQFTTALGVGAHQAHLRAPSGIRAPVACVECHAVPATTIAPGHLDSTLPAEVVPDLGWDRTAQTCTSAWCHGPARPMWTQTGGAFCGSCHGVPPATPSHAGANVSTCASCHPAGFARHIDGVLDVL